MIWIVWISLILAFMYLVTIVIIYYGQEKALLDSEPAHGTPFVSLIVPFRNEAFHLEDLVNDLLGQDYPFEKFECIFIDDHSEDGGPELLQKRAGKSGPGIRLLRLDEKEQGKKSALRKGIMHSRAPLLLSLDADSRVPSGWLRNMVACHLRKKADMVLGPVILEGSGFFSRLQSAEMMGNMALTAGWAGLGKAIMANGANMLFKPEDYLNFRKSVAGSYVSGDDMFLLQYLVQQKKKMVFCFKPEAAVTTKAAGSLKALLHQRLRWAGKAGGYRLPLIWYNLTLVFLVNLMVWLALVLSFFSRDAQLALIILLLVKIPMEYLLCYPVATVLNLRSIHLYLPLVSLLHLIYIPFIGPLGCIVKYDWKGRRYSPKKQY